MPINSELDLAWFNPLSRLMAIYSNYHNRPRTGSGHLYSDSTSRMGAAWPWLSAPPFPSGKPGSEYFYLYNLLPSGMLYVVLFSKDKISWSPFSCDLLERHDPTQPAHITSEGITLTFNPFQIVSLLLILWYKRHFTRKTLVLRVESS